MYLKNVKEIKTSRTILFFLFISNSCNNKIQVSFPSNYHIYLIKNQESKILYLLTYSVFHSNGNTKYFYSVTSNEVEFFKVVGIWNTEIHIF